MAKTPDTVGLQAISTTEAGVVADLAVKAAGAPQVIQTADGREFVAIPEGMDWKETTDPHRFYAKPERIRQAPVLQTVDSLVDYVERFKTDTTVLFADIAANKIVAVVDYHGPEDAKNLDHQANMSLPFSEEWKAWTGIDGKLMEQLAFARFIEENATDVTAPTGAELLDVVRDLQARRKVNFTKAVRTSSDNESFEYSDETTATMRKGDVEIPTKFQLSLPVYFDGQVVTLFAFLRWKLEEGSLALGVKLHRVEHVRQAVFKQIVGDVAARTERPAVFGRLG